MGGEATRLDPDVSENCIIIFPWGSSFIYDYNWALQVLLTSSKLRYESCELEVILNFMRTKSDDLLYFTNGGLDVHINKLRRVFIRL
jgi:hypothetical protein